MPNKVFYEKQREKRRLAREHAQKVQEERHRAREMKEEKWTTKNEFGLVAEHRQLQRKEYIEKIRKESKAMMELALAQMEEYNKREEMIDKEIEEEEQAMKKLIEEQCAYYDEIEAQISPPKEISVDQIVAEIEDELREVYKVFESVFEFNPKMPDLNGEDDGKDQMFAKEIEDMRKEMAANSIKADNLKEQIAEAKALVEKENVRLAAIEQEKEMEVLELEKQIKALEAKMNFLEQEPVEKEEIKKLKGRIEEEEKKNAELKRTLKKLDEMIERKAAEKKEKERVQKKKEKKKDELKKKDMK